MSTSVSSVPSPQIPGAILTSSPITTLPGVDAGLAAALQERGIRRASQLCQLPKPVLIAAFGRDVGTQLWASARGLDGSTVALRDRLHTLRERLRRVVGWRPKARPAGLPAAISTPDTA